MKATTNENQQTLHKNFPAKPTKKGLKSLSMKPVRSLKKMTSYKAKPFPQPTAKENA